VWFCSVIYLFIYLFVYIFYEYAQMVPKSWAVNMFYEPYPSYYMVGSILYLICIEFLLNIYLILIDQLNMGYILVII